MLHAQSHRLKNRKNRRNKIGFFENKSATIVIIQLGRIYLVFEQIRKLPTIKKIDRTEKNLACKT